MYAGLAKLTVVVGHSRSLKDKRMVIRRLKDVVRERLGLSINEVGELESWQRAELGLAVTSVDRHKALEILDEAIRVVRSAAHDRADAEVVGVATDVIRFDRRFDGPAVPLAPVDDRTGAGDKAAGGDDWIPEAWREEVKS